MDAWQWLVLMFFAGAAAGWFVRGICDFFVDVANGKRKA